MPATLTKVTPSSSSATVSNSVVIWGFKGPCDVNDVKTALNTIASGLTGSDQTIHVMSGTHGYCPEADQPQVMVGAVATREQKFADEDRKLLQPKTKDGKPVTVDVHDFNTAPTAEETRNLGQGPTAVIGIAMSRLNTAMRNLVPNGAKAGNQTFLLAYCCSAGT